MNTATRRQSYRWLLRLHASMPTEKDVRGVLRVLFADQKRLSGNGDCEPRMVYQDHHAASWDIGHCRPTYCVCKLLQ
jgi:hypothetical protein